MEIIILQETESGLVRVHGTTSEGIMQMRELLKQMPHGKWRSNFNFADQYSNDVCNSEELDNVIKTDSTKLFCDFLRRHKIARDTVVTLPQIPVIFSRVITLRDHFYPSSDVRFSEHPLAQLDPELLTQQQLYRSTITEPGSHVVHESDVSSPDGHRRVVQQSVHNTNFIFYIQMNLRELCLARAQLYNSEKIIECIKHGPTLRSVLIGGVARFLSSHQPHSQRPDAHRHHHHHHHDHHHYIHGLNSAVSGENVQIGVPASSATAQNATSVHKPISRARAPISHVESAYLEKTTSSWPTPGK